MSRSPARNAKQCRAGAIMEPSPARGPRMTATMARSESIGRVVGVNGSQATVELSSRAAVGDNPTVGKFMGLTTGKSVIIGLITEVAEQPIAATTGGPN